jgi:hypothetical protein
MGRREGEMQGEAEGGGSVPCGPRGLHGVVCGVGTTHGGREDEERREDQIALVELLFMYRKLSQGLCYTALRV